MSDQPETNPESNTGSGPASGSADLDFRRHGFVPGAGTLGVSLLVAALAILFVSSLIGFFIFRSNFQFAVSIRLPPGLWLSTFILLVSSLTMHWAVSAVNHDRQPTLRLALMLTLGLGLAFLVIQGFNWFDLLHTVRVNQAALNAFHGPAASSSGGLPKGEAPLIEAHVLLVVFYVFTVLHALHVIGGIIPLGVTTFKARRQIYSRNYHPGVRYCAIYWHFLDAVWVLIFITLLATF